MSYVAIYVAGDAISLDEVFDPESGASSWIHGLDGTPDHEQRFALAGTRELASEADAAEVDWEASAPRLLGYSWEYLFADDDRDRRADLLTADVSQRIDDAWAAEAAHGKDHATVASARARVTDARRAYVDFNIDYIRSLKSPIALGIYGTT